MTVRGQRQLEEGDILFREGDRGDHAYYIEDGEIEIIKALDSPSENIIQTMSKGEIIGEMAVLEDRPRTASARIKSPATIIELDRSSFLARVTQDPNAAMRIMRTLSDRLRVSTQNNDTFKPEDEAAGQEFSEDFFEDNEDTNTLLSYNPVTLAQKTVLSALVFCLILLGGLISATLIEVETTVSAYARVVPAVPNLTIEAGTEGALKDVLVKAGDLVEENQIIAQFSMAGIEADIKSLSAELKSAENWLSRLQKERTLIANKTAQTENLEGLSDQVLLARLARRNSKIVVFDQKINAAAIDLKHKTSELKVVESEYDIIKEQSDMRSMDNVKKGIVSKQTYFQSQMDLANTERKLIEKESAMSALKGEVEKLKAEKQAFVAEWNADIESQIEQYSETVLTASARLERKNIEREAHIVRSPIQGRVLELKARLEGTILSKGHPIAVVTRAGQQLVVEAEVPPADVENISVDLPVSFKLDALPFQRFGDIKAVITRLDEDATVSRRPGNNEEFFIARIELQSTEPRSAPEDFELRRGMTGKADMITGSRTILSYLLDPLLGAMRTAFREA